MTFLQLVQRLHSEAGRQGTAPTTVVGQTGFNLRFVNWVNAAYEEIQALHKTWKFRQMDLDVDITDAARNYTAADLGLTDFGEWKTNYGDVRLYLVVADEKELEYEPWDDYKQVYMIGAARVLPGRPFVYSIKPDNTIDFYPYPDDDYTVTGEYIKSIQSLTLDTSTIIFPNNYHLLLVWKALMSYAAFENAPEIYAKAQDNYDKLIAKMEITELPQIYWGGTLA